MTAETETETPPTSTENSVTMSLVAMTMEMEVMRLPSLATKHGLARTGTTHIPK